MTGSHVAVVGSGPAGVAAAHALLQNGCRVSMFDVGKTIEPDLEPILDGKSDLSTLQIHELIKARRAAVEKNNNGLPPKLPLGSDFVYRELPDARVKVSDPAILVNSLALGGLSNVWGANACAIRSSDMTGWPFEADRLAPYLESVGTFCEISSERDAVDKLYMTPIGTTPHYPLSKQGQRLHEAIRTHDNALQSRKIFAGRAKIAIGKRASTGAKGCISCGLCMHGCPTNAIFNSRNVVRDLQRNSNFDYIPSAYVERYQERERSVALSIRDVSNSPLLGSAPLREVEFERVFIGAGTIHSTALVARSLKWTNHTFSILDSQKWYFPFLSWSRVRGATTEQANTLAQIYLQLEGLASTPTTVHAQLYGYNELVLDSFRGLFGKYTDAFGRNSKWLFERIMIGMVYLHSDVSGRLQLNVSENSTTNGVAARVTGELSAKAEEVVAEFYNRLIENRKYLGGIPVARLAKQGMPGRSQHFGGTLPMRETPSDYETDLWGRPRGSARTHIVDTSVFPSIPGTPTTYPMMANASRIATEALLLNR